MNPTDDLSGQVAFVTGAVTRVVETFGSPVDGDDTTWLEPVSDEQYREALGA